MKTNLLALVCEKAGLANALGENGGELTPALEAALEVNEKELAQKLDGYKVFSERLEMEEKYWKEKAKQSDAIAKSYKKAAERLEENLKTAMDILGVKEIAGVDYRYTLSEPAICMVVDDVEALPKEFQIIETKSDNAKIKEALKAGVSVPGAHLEPGKKSLRSFPNRS